MPLTLLKLVRNDWNNYRPLCVSGGMIAMHDICPAQVEWIQVDKVWRSIQAQGYITQELVCQYGLDWSGIGCVYIS